MGDIPATGECSRLVPKLRYEQALLYVWKSRAETTQRHGGRFLQHSERQQSDWA
jgi:hypothetical protein